MAPTLAKLLVELSTNEHNATFVNIIHIIRTLEHYPDMHPKVEVAGQSARVRNPVLDDITRVTIWDGVT